MTPTGAAATPGQSQPFDDNAVYRHAETARALLKAGVNVYEVVEEMAAILAKLETNTLATLCAIAVTDLAIGTGTPCDNPAKHVAHPWTCGDGERHIGGGV